MMTGLRGGYSNSGAPNLSVTLQNQSQRPSSALPSPFFGSRTMVSFEDIHTPNGLNTSFFRPYDFDDDYFHQPEKKRRLTVDQAHFLEKSFDKDDKLEPERKIQLAKEIGLQPRQVSIWFQNRRARWKTKRLEKDYDSLQAGYNSLKDDYKSLAEENDELKAEVRLIKDKLVMKEKEKENSEFSFDTITPQVESTPMGDSVSESRVWKKSILAACKQEDMMSSAAIFDLDSPHYPEAGDSSYVFEPDQSDEEDNLRLHTYTFPKVEDMDYSDPSTSSCNFGFAAEDHAFWSWSY